MWAAIALSFGLAMDATAVSAARGLGRRNPRELLILPLMFGGFQTGMSAIGWLGGRWAGEYIARWENWVAFGLLVAIGCKMFYEAWHREDGEEQAAGTLVLYLGLALATSIDAAAAGLTLPLLPVAPWVALALIGTITAACSAAGYGLGRAVGARIGSKLEILGGLVLIGIGIDILIKGL